ncbi:MAG: PilZ domain-containing protein, partial [Bdellovibrionales bacterium]|nr:PilZ domain-containing protein [Bdellovibrionales bacterium]
MAKDTEDPNKKDYLNKITAAERAELLGSVAAMPGLEVDVALTNGDHFKAKCGPLKGSIVEISASVVPEGTVPGSVGVSFVLNLSKYLVKSSLQWTEQGRWFLDLRGDFYLVQRRKNFRVDVPIHIVPKVALRQINRPEKEILARMLNISLGGCFLEIEGSTQALQQEAQIQVTMTVEGGKVVPLNAVIKRVTRAPDDPKRYRLGVEFGKL